MRHEVFLIVGALLVGVGNTCFAAVPSFQGEISFQGSVMAGPCVPSLWGKGLTLDCPTLTDGNIISPLNIYPELSISAIDHQAVHLKVIDTGKGRNAFSSLKYTVLDYANQPIMSGKYIVTLTYQ